MKRCVTVLVACVGVLATNTVAAQPHVLHTLGSFTDPGNAEQGHISPLHDDEAKEYEYWAGAKRIVGNEPVKHTYVSFTFDDGPSYTTTPKVIKALDKYDIPATFFVVGWRITGVKPETRRNRAVLKQIIKRGHFVGNHTFKHPDMSKQSLGRIRKEVERTSDAIARLTGYRPYLFRPPYGNVNNRLRQYLIREEYIEVRWTTDSADFKIRNGDRMVNRTLKSIQSWKGGVVLFHDTKPVTANNIDRFFAKLEALNCKRWKKKQKMFIPVSLHYFTWKRNKKNPGAKDQGPRKIPAEVRARTRRYIRKLTNRCKTRLSKKKS